MRAQLLTVHDATTILDIPRHRIMKLCQDRQIPHYDFGDNIIRFTEEDLFLWLDKQTHDRDPSHSPEPSK